MKRYLTVVGIILVVLVVLGVLLKPPLEDMRKGVAEGLQAYAQAKAGEGAPVPAVTDERSQDWIVAVGHEARIGDLTFWCWGAFKVTLCVNPE
jgi:hypothetical protein